MNPTPEQIKHWEDKAAKEGWFHRSLVAFDIACNVFFLRGLPDETISSHSERAALEGKLWGKCMVYFLNLFESNHGEKATAGDLERADSIAKVEQKTLGEK